MKAFQCCIYEVIGYVQTCESLISTISFALTGPWIEPLIPSTAGSAPIAMPPKHPRYRHRHHHRGGGGGGRRRRHRCRSLQKVLRHLY